MLSRRWKGFIERGRFVPAMGKAWIKARKHDRFYRAAKRQAYRSRAAIKLSQIDLRYGVFHEGDLVVDLGAAPGGWSQIARERIGAKGRVVAIDLARIAPIEGVETFRGDFTRPEVQATLFEAIRRPADIVMSDMAPKLSGNRTLDVAKTLDLADHALSFAVRALRPGGTFLAKVFQGEGYPGFLRRVAERFEAVKGVKPSASAPASAEIYVLAMGRR
jgi:23S rRNA (uridine2552-2'-O)-methyltransferase